MKKIVNLPDDWEQQLTTMSDGEIATALYNILRNANDVDDADDATDKMNKEDTKQAILGFTEFFKGITGNQDLKIPDDIAKKYEIEPNTWIPCSERLPKPNEKNGRLAKYYLVQNRYGDMFVARYDGIGWEQIYQH